MLLCQMWERENCQGLKQPYRMMLEEPSLLADENILKYFINYKDCSKPTAAFHKSQSSKMQFAD